MDIKIDITDMKLDPDNIRARRSEAGKVLDGLWAATASAGWVQAPLHQSKEELEYILNVADILKQEAEMMVVIGSEDAVLPAKAAVAALPNTLDGIDIRFAGQSFCTSALTNLIAEMSRRGTVLCVISKTGKEPEVQAAFSVLKELMVKKYGGTEHASRRTIVITETGSALHKEAQQEGYLVFNYPANFSELYGALTSAGLFPMAAAGIDIRDFISGAAAMAASPQWDSDGADYAIARAMIRHKCSTERISTFDTRFEHLCRWVKRIYQANEAGEIMTIAGGYYEENNCSNVLETIITTEKCVNDIVIPDGELKGKSLNDFNRAWLAEVMESFAQNERYAAYLCMPEVNPYNYGQLVYFLQTSCEITAELQ